jgi:tetratricopeptide (TPR) repeat protein
MGHRTGCCSPEDRYRQPLPTRRTGRAKSLGKSVAVMWYHRRAETPLSHLKAVLLSDQTDGRSARRHERLTHMRRFARFLRRDTSLTPFELQERAVALAQEGDFERAIEFGSLALTGLRNELGDESPNVAVAITNLASYYAGAQRWSEALPLYEDGLARKIRQYGEDHPSCANTLFRIARCHAGLGDVDAAIAAYRRAVAIFDRQPESNPEIHRIATWELVTLAIEAGHREEVRDLSRQIARLAARQLLSGDASWEETLQEAAAACLSEGDFDGLMYAIRDGAGPADGILVLRGLADWLLSRRRSNGATIAGLASRKGPWESAFTRELAQLRAGEADGARESGLEATELARKQFGERSIELAASLNAMAVAYQRLGDDEEAFTRYSEALVALEGIVAPDDDWYLTALDNVATSLGRLRRYADAKETLARIVAIRRAQVPPDRSGLAIALCDLGDAAEGVDDLERALRAALEARDVLPLDDPLRYAANIKARVFELLLAAEPDNLERPYELLQQGRLLEAEPAFRQLLALLTWTAGHDDLGTIAAQDGLGGVLLKLGRLAEAESLLTDAHETLLATPNAPISYLAVTGHLAILRRRLGQFEEAERLHKTAMELSLQLGVRSREYALALINAAAFYKDVGRMDLARTLYEQAQPIVADVLGTQHPDYILLLSNLGDLELDFGNVEGAVDLLNKACSIAQTALGEQHEYYLSALHNLGRAQHMLGHTAEALATLERVLTLKQKALGLDNVDVAVTLTALAELHDELGRPDLAENLFEQSLKLRTSVYGDRHASVARAHGMLAQFAWKAGNLDKARAEFSAALSFYRRQLIDVLPGMAEDDRVSYWEEVRLLLELFTAFALGDSIGHPDTAGELYDLQLFRKALMLQCVANMRAAAAASGRPEIRSQYSDWLGAKRLLASALLSQSPRSSGIDVDTLSAKATELEKALAKLIGADAIMAGVGEVTWRDVLGTLAPFEAAIEIVRSPISGFPSPGKPTYAALVLRGDDPGPPQVVTLGSTTALEGLALEQYLDHREVVWRGSYDDYWGPLAPVLAGVTRAHVAPDGVYGRLDLNILFSGDENAFLGEALDLRIVGSTRDLIDKPRPPIGDKTAALFGRPAYTVPAGDDGQPDAPTLFSFLEAPGHFPDLPGTELEVLEIASVLEHHGWQVERYVGEGASKAAIQQLSHPRVLHVATHGFYLELQQTILRSPTRGALALLGPREEDAPGAAAFFRALADSGFSPEAAPVVTDRAASPLSTGRLDPMFRSGVALAGASYGPSATANPGGMLTAYEAASLNLYGTELVVLSACDSAHIRAHARTTRGGCTMRARHCLANGRRYHAGIRDNVLPEMG